MTRYERMQFFEALCDLRAAYARRSDAESGQSRETEVICGGVRNRTISSSESGRSRASQGETPTGQPGRDADGPARGETPTGEPRAGRRWAGQGPGRERRPAGTAVR